MKLGVAAKLVLVFFILGAFAVAQEHKPADPHQPAQAQPPQHGRNDQHAAQQPTAEQQLTHASQEAAGHDPHAEFKQSPSVKAVGRLLGVGPSAAYWVSILLNFAIIALLIFLVMRAKMPGMFRDRTAAIRRQMEEAHQASEEARSRLAEIEGRLARLDSEIAAMQATAENDARDEEQRVRAAAEEDRQKIVHSAEQEIAAAARSARSDLKAYVAELAVSLAERRIQVSPATDQEIVRSFVAELGKDGK